MKYPSCTVYWNLDIEVRDLATHCYITLYRYAGKCEARKYQDSVLRITEIKELVIRTGDWLNIIYKPAEQNCG